MEKYYSVTITYLQQETFIVKGKSKKDIIKKCDNNVGTFNYEDAQLGDIIDFVSLDLIEEKECNCDRFCNCNQQLIKKGNK